MNYEENFKHGFLKAAATYGVTEHDAVELYRIHKQANDMIPPSPGLAEGALGPALGSYVGHKALGSGALGALGGGALGALGGAIKSPGEDEEGNPNSRLGNAFRYGLGGALGGGMLGAGVGAYGGANDIHHAIKSELGRTIQNDTNSITPEVPDWQNRMDANVGLQRKLRDESLLDSAKGIYQQGGISPYLRHFLETK